MNNRPSKWQWEPDQTAWITQIALTAITYSSENKIVLTFVRNSLRNIGESQGSIESGSRLFLAKLKNANRLRMTKSNLQLICCANILPIYSR